tara:strand:+ start:2317 stop:2535 length:219 start_codon:yes stop_codon:yes gene_type:complete
MSSGDIFKIGRLVKVNRSSELAKHSGHPDCIGTIVSIWSLDDKEDNRYAMVMWSNGAKSSILLSWLDVVMET